MFSIVIPLYNKEKYIRATVESILVQDYKDFEVIIVNDGSTDNSLNEIQDISDSRIKVINKENAGVAAARNTGMSHASFKWIAFIDADDIWASNHLSELKLIIERFPSSGLISTAYDLFYGKLPILNVNDDLDLSYKIRSINYFLEPIVQTSAAAIKKSAFEEIGGFNNYTNGEDFEYWVRLALKYPVAFSNKVTCYYRRNTGGITNSVSDIIINKEYFREVRSLKDASPSLEYLLNESEKNPDLFKDSDIITYINNSLMKGVRVWLSNENMIMAKQAAKLGIPSSSRTYITMLMISMMPAFVLKKAAISYKKIKYLKR